MEDERKKTFSLELKGGSLKPNEVIAGLPSSPGVYIMKDNQGEILYVGKAAHLSKRVRSYFTGNIHDPKTAALVEKAASLEVIITESESEALLLEANLIKTYQPRYNIDLKDDKSFPYIKITRDEFPRLLVVRERKKNDSADYFGPFAFSGGVRSLVRHLRSTFYIRTCSGKSPGRKSNRLQGPDGDRVFRECLNYHIGRCKAPCTERISAEDYAVGVELLKAVLNGKVSDLEERLEREMKDASDTLNFEKASEIRDRLNALRKITSTQHVVGSPDENFDTVAVEAAGDMAAGVVLEVREGRIIGRRAFILTRPGNESPEELLTRLIERIYLDGRYVPPKVFVDLELSKATILEEFLFKVAGRRVEIKHPRRGEKKKLSAMASINAAMLVEERNRNIPGGTAAPVMEELRRLLGVKTKLSVIEAFDISNTQGAYPVASMVVFRNGLPDKKGYRRFKITDITGPDDYAMMREVVGRRYSRVLREKGNLPDLILVDGGLGQLHAAAGGLADAGVKEKLQLAAIAKKEELIFLPDRNVPVCLPAGSAALRLVQHVRDEAHRFAITYHRKLRGKSMTESFLDTIPGVGRTTKKRLLGRFGSVAALRRASVDEISKVKGVGKKLARRIKSALA